MNKILVTLFLLLSTFAAFGQRSGSITQSAPTYFGRRATDPATCSTNNPSWYWNTVSAEFKFCSGTNTFSSLWGGSGTKGSVPFFNATGSVDENNARFHWNSDLNRFMLLDSNYLNAAGVGVNADTPFSVSSNDFVAGTVGSIATSTHWFNETLDTKLNQTGNNKYMASRYANLVAAGTYTGGTIMGDWLTVSNEGNEGNGTSTIYGSLISANADSDAGTVIGLEADVLKGNINSAAEFFAIRGIAASGYSPVNNLTAGYFYARNAGGIGTTTTQARAVWPAIMTTAGNTFTNAKGIALEGWTNGGSITNSYGIYADTSIDVGTNKYFIYSTSTSPSLFSGSGQFNTASFSPVAYGDIGSAGTSDYAMLQASSATQFNTNLNTDVAGLYVNYNRGGANVGYYTTGIFGSVNYSGSGSGFTPSVGGRFTTYNVGSTDSTAILIGTDTQAVASVPAWSVNGLQISATASAAVNDLYGIRMFPSLTSSGSAVNYKGIELSAGANANTTTFIGFDSIFTQSGTGTTGSASGIKVSMKRPTSGTITNAYGINLSGWTGAAGFTNTYGIYADNSIDKGATNKYFIYSLSTSPSLFTGNITVASGAVNSGSNGGTGSIDATNQLTVVGNVMHVALGLGGSLDSIVSTGVPAGTVIYLVFNQDITVNSTGNIKLSGGAAFSATTNDTLTLFYDGTNFHESSRVVK